MILMYEHSTSYFVNAMVQMEVSDSLVRPISIPYQNREDVDRELTASY